jgi:hypothetical protein
LQPYSCSAPRWWMLLNLVMRWTLWSLRHSQLCWYIPTLGNGYLQIAWSMSIVNAADIFVKHIWISRCSSAMTHM